METRTADLSCCKSFGQKGTDGYATSEWHGVKLPKLNAHENSRLLKLECVAVNGLFWEEALFTNSFGLKSK